MQKTVKLIFGRLLIACTAISCFSASNRESVVRGIEFRSSVPIVDKQTDSIIMWNREDTIYFYKDMILFRKRSNQIQDDGSIVPHPKGNKYMYRNNQRLGIIYYPETITEEPITFYVDSFLLKNAFGTLSYEEVMASSDSSYSTERKGSRKFTESYIQYKLPNDSYSNTDIFYYDKDFPDVPFSLSKKLDSVKKAKLVRFQAIFDPVESSPYKSLRKRREINIEIKQIQVKDQQVLMSYFNRFEKESAGKLPEPPKKYRIP